jgi:hypothetical protein
MAGMRGLELVCIGRSRAFEIRYESGRYVDLAGRDLPDLLDMTCFACGASYYTLDGDEGIEFCPNCGRFEKRRFESLADLLEWSRGQHLGFNRFSGNKTFAVRGRDSWELRFAPDEDALRRRGERGDIHEVGGT